MNETIIFLNEMDADAWLIVGFIGLVCLAAILANLPQIFRVAYMTFVFVPYRFFRLIAGDKPPDREISCFLLGHKEHRPWPPPAAIPDGTGYSYIPIRCARCGQELSRHY